MVGIAKLLKTSPDTLGRWLDENPKLRAAFDEGREREHMKLFTKLFDAAMSGNITAAIFLLKARHKYRDNGDERVAQNNLQINFTLPGAVPLADYQAQVIAANPKAAKAVKNEQYRIGHDHDPT